MRYEASEEHGKATMTATSSGSPYLRTGRPGAPDWCLLSGSPGAKPASSDFIIRVSIGAGHTALIRTPFRRNSRATQMVMPNPACFEAM